MTDRFIKLRSGLLEKKHRDEMGMRVWLYLYMLDIANWEKGTIFGWTDKNTATDLDMPWRTVQGWRQDLANTGYITCLQKHDGLDIVIHNYVNPRDLTTQNPVGGSTSKPSMPTLYTDLNNTIVMPRKTLYALRRHFSKEANVSMPPWSDLSTASRRKYGFWWNAPLKNMWLAADQDEERTKKVISLTLTSVKGKWDVYSPGSIEKAYYKYLNTKDDNRGFERA